MFLKLKRIISLNSKDSYIRDIINLSLLNKPELIKFGLYTIASSSMFMILPMCFKNLQKLSNNKFENKSELKVKYSKFVGQTLLYLTVLGYLTKKRIIISKKFEDKLCINLRKKLYLSKIFKHGDIYNLKQAEYTNSSLITKSINDCYTITNTLSDVYFRFIRGITFGVGGISIMIYAFPSLFLYSSIGIVILSLFNKKMNAKIAELSNLQIKKLSEISTHLGSSYGIQKLIEINKSISFFYSNFNNLLSENHKLIINFSKQRANYIMFMESKFISFWNWLLFYINCICILLH